MKLSVTKMEQSGNIRIITFTGDHVRGVENILAEELDGLTEGMDGGHLLLDFMNVSCITSVELGSLIALHRRMKQSGVRLTLFNLAVPVYEVFTITHLHTLLAICREQLLPHAFPPTSCQPGYGMRFPERGRYDPLHPESVRKTIREVAWTTEERLQDLEQLGKRMNAYVSFMCRPNGLTGTSSEARAHAVAAFHERMVILERELGHIHDSFKLG